MYEFKLGSMYALVFTDAIYPYLILAGTFVVGFLCGKFLTWFRRHDK